MSQTAANVVDQVVPQMPVRHWVLSLSIPPRPPPAQQPKLLRPVPHDGLAVDGHRLLLGPVLRGWSALPAFAFEARGNQLHLVPVDNCGTMLRKHVLQIDGQGIRDRQFSGDDLRILGGPTMVLNGEIRVFNWPAARRLRRPTASRFVSRPR
jgi:hypothetical protein